MERKLLIVFALTFLVIMLFQPLLKKYGPQPPAKPPSSAAQSAAQPAAAAPAQNSAQQTPPFVPPGRQATHESAPLQATSESETVIENDVYRIVFTNRGAPREVVGAEKIHRRKRRSARTGQRDGRGEIWLSR